MNTSLLEQHRDEILLMAAGAMDESNRQWLTKVIESDAECLVYWNEVSEVAESLKHDATRQEQVTLSSRFHERLMKELLISNKENEVRNEPDAWFFLKHWRPLTLASGVAMFLCVALLQYDHDPSESLPDQTRFVTNKKIETTSLSYYRTAITASTTALDDLLSNAIASNSNPSPNPTYRLIDSRLIDRDGLFAELIE